MARNRQFLIELARAFGGAILFSLLMLRTAEMWELGVYIDRLPRAVARDALPLSIGLSHFVGFEDTFGWKDAVIDAFVAYAGGIITAAPGLVLLGAIDASTPWTRY